jgi:hypothetical protein
VFFRYSLGSVWLVNFLSIGGSEKLALLFEGEQERDDDTILGIENKKRKTA